MTWYTWKNKYFIIGIVLLSFALRLYRLDYQPLWSDEIDVLNFSHDSVSTLIHNIDRPGWNGPLFYFTLHFWLVFLGDSSFILRFFSVTFGVLSTSLAIVLVKNNTCTISGMYTGLMIATSPYLVWYSQDGKMYSILLFLTLTSIVLLIKALRQNQLRFWVFFILVTGVSWYVHILSVLLLPFYLLIIFNNALRARKFTWAYLLLVIPLGLLYLPLIKWQILTWLSSFTTGHYYFTLPQILQTQLFVFSSGYPSRFQLFLIPLFMVLFFLGLHASISRKKDFIFIGYFFIPIGGLYFSSLGMPIYTDRYLITIAPAFYAICTIGLIKLKQIKPVIVSPYLISIITLNCYVVFVQANKIIKHGVN